MNNDEYKKKCEWLARFYAEAAEKGRLMQVNEWGQGEWIMDTEGPCMGSSPENWRLKPEPEKAYVVWFDGLPPHLSQSLQSARNWNKFECNDNGTIQEIERPD